MARVAAAADSTCGTFAAFDRGLRPAAAAEGFVLIHRHRRGSSARVTPARCAACCMLCCMSAVRTQVYLTQEQRRLIDDLVEVEGVTLAEVVRRALDAFLQDRRPDPSAALEATFGADPLATYPNRDEWNRG